MDSGISKFSKWSKGLKCIHSVRCSMGNRTRPMYPVKSTVLHECTMGVNVHTPKSPARSWGTTIPRSLKDWGVKCNKSWWHKTRHKLQNCRIFRIKFMYIRTCEAADATIYWSLQTIHHTGRFPPRGVFVQHETTGSATCTTKHDDVTKWPLC